MVAVGVGPFGVWATSAVSQAVQDTLYGPDASEPSCSWVAVRFQGVDADQATLIRCYLRAVAERSADGLHAVVRSRDNGGPTGFSAADFAHAATVAGGTTTVTIDNSDNVVDSADASVQVRYADGTRQVFEIHLANPMSLHSWRFWDVGTYPSDSGGPPPARALSVVGDMLGDHGDPTVLAAH
ncbi:hypothetical protein [Streptacidiphilus sp. MAP12-20]|uniref:hypothetical protein n=1 Tax=Streptacidiphilus sp. MAP12-20 TaxID=3156299 RepID=UPI003513E095